MNHITELVVEEVKIEGGQQIRTAAYRTPNNTLFNGLTWLSKGLLFMMECKSNNMSKSMQPRDVTDLWKLWNAHKADFALAQKFSNHPMPIIEFKHTILMPNPVEMRRYRNMKVQRVASQWFSYCHVCMSRDSSLGTYIVEMADYDEIVQAQEATEAVMTMFFGTGLPIEGEVGKWDTGIELPALSELGHIVPDNDMDALVFAEPSIGAPASGLPDAKDTPAGGPIVGGNLAT